MFQQIRNLEQGDLFLISYLSDLKMGRIIYNTGQYMKVELAYSTNSDIREKGIIKEVKYISPYRFVYKIN